LLNRRPKGRVGDRAAALRALIPRGGLRCGEVDLFVGVPRLESPLQTRRKTGMRVLRLALVTKRS